MVTTSEPVDIAELSLNPLVSFLGENVAPVAKLREKQKEKAIIVRRFYEDGEPLCFEAANVFKIPARRSKARTGFVG